MSFDLLPLKNNLWYVVDNQQCAYEKSNPVKKRLFQHFPN